MELCFLIFVGTLIYAGCIEIGHMPFSLCIGYSGVEGATKLIVGNYF